MGLNSVPKVFCINTKYECWILVKFYKHNFQPDGSIQWDEWWIITVQGVPKNKYSPPKKFLEYIHFG